MNRRQFISRLGAVCTLPLFTGCSQPSSLKVGLVPWVGYETLCLAKNLNWLPQEIKLTEYSNSRKKISALTSGELDAACMTVAEMISARNDGIALTAITVFDVSSGADVVIARDNISSLKDLKNKRIGLEKNTLGALMLAKLLSFAELSQNDVILVDSPMNKQKEYWLNNKVDVLISYNPVSSTIINESGHIIFDSSQIPDAIIDVLAVKTELLASHDYLLKQLVKAHFKGVSHIRYNHDDALYRIADHQKIPFEDVKYAISGIIQPSIEANREYLSNPNGRLIPASRQISKILVENKIIPVEDKLIDFMSDDYLPSNMAKL